ncbi:MAG TPA: alanine--glyoxylate aminotransferase family protein [Candidatus Ozemobacteraceae bacterium]|nr:alanine--glyoxylate aminotransferase family protein [Candidatus Ozemobacteraceae bacterium]
MDLDILLMTPGPVTLDSEILLAGAQPLKHHRTNDFAPLYADCVARCKRIFKTKKHLFLTTSSGTGAMETAIANHFHPGEQVLTVETGSFGERFTEIAKSFRLEAIPLKYPWGHRAKVKDIIRMLDQNPKIKGVTVTFNETSTGVRNDIEAIGKALKDRDVLFITDGVSGIGALPFDMDGWHVDVAVSASQKGFLTPPAIGMIALSDRAYDKMMKVQCNGYYFDLKHYKKNQDLAIPSYPWTPAISVMFSFQKALEKMERIGMEKIFAHYHKLAEGLRKAIEAMGLSIFTQPDARSDVLTVINSPDGIHPSKIVKDLHDRYSVLIAGGQGEITDKVFRITTIGTIGEREIVGTVGLLEIALARLKFLKEPGVGTAALLKAFAAMEAKE